MISGGTKVPDAVSPHTNDRQSYGFLREALALGSPARVWPGHHRAVTVCCPTRYSVEFKSLAAPLLPAAA